jgi:type IV pilus assembly protein PilM
MSKPPSSAIGIDVGRHSIKAVVLARRGSNRVALTDFAILETDEKPVTKEQETGDKPFSVNDDASQAGWLDRLEGNLRKLLLQLGGHAKACGIAVSHEEAMVRILEQNTIPPALLRDALRINGPMLLSQDCRDWVIDCAAITSSEPTPADQKPGDSSTHYLVGGLPRKHVAKVHEACVKNKLADTLFQLPPIALFNAFEFSNPEAFGTQAFVLVDIGHFSSTVIVGVKGELVLVRTLDYGGSQFADQLILHGAASLEEVIAMLAEEEVLTIENARLSLTELVRLISSSIGFFEARREETMPRVYLSGGLAKLPAISKLLTEELRVPCEKWDPFYKCELGLSNGRKSALAEQLPILAVACGAAAEILKGQ